MSDVIMCSECKHAQHTGICGVRDCPCGVGIQMILHCPMGHRHVDAGGFIKKPHHTHACQTCGIVWRPAIENTVGVQFLPGFKDAP